MPWKNGGGVTTELLIEPPGATLDNFEWRLSMARLDADGPFSAFPGIDRYLAMLEGTVILTIDGHARALAAGDETVRFSGEAPVYAKLPGSGVSATDLNLMVRRGQFGANLTRHVVAERSEWRPPSRTAALFLKSGQVRADDGTHVEILSAHDVLVLPDGGAAKTIRVVSETSAELYCIEVHS